MPIAVACPCGRKLQIADAFAGKQGRCPVCGRTLDIPMSAEPHLLPVEVGAARVDTAPEVTAEQVVVEMPRSRDVQEASPATFPPELEVAKPTYNLYSAGDATLAAFLGSILAGSIILALNYRRLGQRQAAWWMVLFGLGAFLTHFAIVSALPEAASAIVSIALIVVGLVVIFQIGKALQGTLFDAHLRHGGQKASTGSAAGIGLLCGLLLFAIIVGLSVASFTLFNDLGERMTFGTNEEIYYAKGIAEGQARALGHFLQQDGFFDGRSAKTVTVARNNETFIVSFVVVRNSWNSPGALEWFQDIAGRLSQQVFDGGRVEIRLLDEDLTLQKTIK